MNFGAIFCLFSVRVALFKTFLNLQLFKLIGFIHHFLLYWWVQSGQAYLQDRHGLGNLEPAVDRYKDWTIVNGCENGTHTMLHVGRPLDTCDPLHDHVVTVRRERGRFEGLTECTCVLWAEGWWKKRLYVMAIYR